MNDAMEKLIKALMQLRSDSRQACLLGTDESFHSLIDKYNMLFLGKDFNSIYTNELITVLKNYFDLEIELNALNKLIPDACRILNMSYDPMTTLEDIANRSLYCYQILL